MSPLLLAISSSAAAGLTIGIVILFAVVAVIVIVAKLIVVGMTATKFSIADPTDPGMLEVVGFDLSAPAVRSSESPRTVRKPTQDAGSGRPDIASLVESTQLFRNLYSTFRGI